MALISLKFSFFLFWLWSGACLGVSAPVNLCSHQEKVLHVDMWLACWEKIACWHAKKFMCKSFHDNMHFFLNMHVWKKMHVDIDWQKFHVKLELNYAVVCGEKFYSMATSLPSSVGLVSNWGVFLGESPHHLHRLLSVAPPHVPHVQSIQGATLSVPGFGLRDCAGVLVCNPVEAGGGNTWIRWTSE